MSNIMHKKIIWVPISVIVSLAIIWFILTSLILPFMWNYLVVDETPEPADVIIVLSGGNGRAEYGVELYQQGYSDYILFAGSDAAISMKSTAISNGISEDNILIDSKSTTTYENATNSLNIMKDQNLKTAIIVTSAYHTKRSSLIFAQVLSRDNFKICSVPLEYHCPSLSSNQWWKQWSTSETVASEYFKLIFHYVFKR